MVRTESPVYALTAGKVGEPSILHSQLSYQEEASAGQKEEGENACGVNSQEVGHWGQA